MKSQRILVKKTLLITALSLIVVTSAAHSEIIQYEDDEGIIHFIDAPKDRSVKPIIRDQKPESDIPPYPGSKESKYCKTKCSSYDKAGVSIDVKKCIHSCLNDPNFPL